MWAARALLLELHPLSASHYTHPLQVWAAYVLLLEQSTPGLDPGLGYQSALALLLREYAEAAARVEREAEAERARYELLQQQLHAAAAAQREAEQSALDGAAAAAVRHEVEVGRAAAVGDELGAMRPRLARETALRTAATERARQAEMQAATVPGLASELHNLREELHAAQAASTLHFEQHRQGEVARATLLEELERAKGEVRELGTRNAQLQDRAQAAEGELQVARWSVVELGAEAKLAREEVTQWEQTVDRARREMAEARREAEARCEEAIEDRLKLRWREVELLGQAKRGPLSPLPLDYDPSSPTPLPHPSTHPSSSPLNQPLTQPLTSSLTPPLTSPLTSPLIATPDLTIPTLAQQHVPCYVSCAQVEALEASRAAWQVQEQRRELELQAAAQEVR